MKKIFLSVLTLQVLSLCTFGQVLFNDSFDNLTLQTYTTSASSVQYTDVPANFSVINDGFGNDTGSVSNPNSPFHIPANKTTGWAVVYNAIENDTFLVSTSWLDSASYTADRWVITPVISNISANTVLTWRAKSPDPSFPDGYEVYGTAVQGALTNQDFTLGDRLFVLADGNTAGASEQNTWTKHSVNIGFLAGQTLRFAFRDNSKNMYQLWIDDIKVVNLPHTNDAALEEVITDKYVLVGSTNFISTRITNNGASDLVTLIMGYSINNSTPNYEEVDPASPGLTYEQSADLSFALPYSLSSPGLYSIKAWINQVNSTTDENAANDTATFYVTVMTSAPSKTLMMEQFVSANNGESPDAQARTTALQSAPAVIVNIHDQDSLKVAGSATLISEYKRAFGTALIDRTYFSGTDLALTRPDYGPWVDVELFRIGPVSVSIVNKSYTDATRQLSFDVKADFASEVRGDYRIIAYLTENQVCGSYSDTTINGYNQLNNYYNVPWSQYEGLGYYSPAAGTYVMNSLIYKHQNTLVHTLDGPYGLPGIIPAIGAGGPAGPSFQKTFTLTLPTPPANVHKFNPDNIYIVGFIAEYNSDKTKRNILNSVQEKLNANPEFVGVPEITPGLSLSVYPNPSGNGLFYLKAKDSDAYDLKVYDLFGKCLKAESSRGNETLDLSGFSEGIYLLTLRSGRQVTTQKLVIQKN